MIQYATLYEHNPSSFTPVYMAVVLPGASPVSTDWVPAYRDTMGGHRVVWVRSELVEGDVWVRDHMGVRKAKLYR